jgi:hypothetical protein
MSLGVSSTTLILGAILGLSIMLNMTYFKLEMKYPSIKAIRVADKKGKQVAWIHDPEGSTTCVAMNLVHGSNQLDLGKFSETYGVKFKPRDMNQAEFLDRKLAMFHYMASYPHNVTVRGVAALSRIRRIIESRGVTITAEKLSTIMHRDLTRPLEDIRKSMIMGSEDRINDAELKRLGEVQQELKVTKNNTVGAFVFADANDFLYSVGMSAASSLREWKSYIIAVTRGEIKAGGFTFDAKSIGMLLIFAALAYVISQSGSFNAISSISV